MNFFIIISQKIKLNVEDLPSVDPIRELLFLCYNGNFPTLLMLLLAEPSLLLQPIQHEIGDCPKVEHESSWQKLQSTISSETTSFTGKISFSKETLFSSISFCWFPVLNLISYLIYSPRNPQLVKEDLLLIIL